MTSRYGSFDLTGVLNSRKAFGNDDCFAPIGRCRTLWQKPSFRWRRDLPGFDRLSRSARAAGETRARIDFAAGIVEPAEELGGIDSGVSGGASALTTDLKIIGEGLRAGQDVGVVGVTSREPRTKRSRGFGQSGVWRCDFVAPAELTRTGSRSGSGNSDSRAQIPSSAWARCGLRLTFQSRVSCEMRPPDSRTPMWRSISYSSARCRIAEGVEIFYFGLGAEFLGAAQAHAHVGIAAQRALFHVAIADLRISSTCLSAVR